MKREARLLLGKAVDSLVEAVGRFNSPHDRGRIATTLILLDHAFEMLLKASIVERGGSIRATRGRETIGFDACVRKGLSDGHIQFLTEDQALTLQATNGLRDAAQHHIVDVSEQQLYMHAQSGVTLFRDVMGDVFGANLCDYLPERVLPVSTSPPADLGMLFDREVDAVKSLLAPGRRRHTEARARLRPLAILDANVQGEKLQPSEGALDKMGRSLLAGEDWREVFPGAASIDLTSSGEGARIELRIVKKEGVPTMLVPEGTAGASVVAVKRVNELDYYSLNVSALAEKVGLTAPRTTALIRYLGLQDDVEYYKRIMVGKVAFKRYSMKALERLKRALGEVSMDEVWRTHGPRRREATRTQ
jgi:hypothetical protein